MCSVGCGGASLTANNLFVNMNPGSVYAPQTVTVAGGQTVTWVNRDSVAHSVTVDTQAGGPDSDSVHPAGMTNGQTYFWTVPNAPSGTKYYYHCRFHGTAGNGSAFGTGMTGVVIVQ